ncbi:hypothetical protein [Shewanella algae]|uniref:hypothetical protein n=1 Tax=Shewanella algae TaxID=38313 RepID=UPI001AADF591|nr:hypothetical protein [Shewanella algae]MBO2618328.1 hypothetical protein [Shewanella algae]
MTTERAKKAGRNKLTKKREALLEQFWGDELEQLKIWSRHEHDGFASIPRTLPYVCHIIDKLSGTGVPLSQTYMALWCRMSDEGLIEIKEKETIAYESGFSGQRAVHTWTTRMKKLHELGFIDCRKGTCGDFHYTLLLNPMATIKNIYEDKPKDEAYNNLAARMAEVGAKWD